MSVRIRKGWGWVAVPGRHARLELSRGCLPVYRKASTQRKTSCRTCAARAKPQAAAHPPVHAAHKRRDALSQFGPSVGMSGSSAQGRGRERGGKEGEEEERGRRGWWRREGGVGGEGLSTVPGMGARTSGMAIVESVDSRYPEVNIRRKYSERAKRMNLCACTVRPSTTNSTSENCALSTIDSRSPESDRTAAAAGFCNGQRRAGERRGGRGTRRGGGSVGG